MFSRLRSPPESVFFSAAPTTMFAAFAEAEFGELAVDAARAVAPGEVRRADRRGEVHVLLDGEVIVEGVVLRDVGDEFAQRFVIRVERLAVEQDISLGGRSWPARRAAAWICRSRWRP